MLWGPKLKLFWRTTGRKSARLSAHITSHHITSHHITSHHITSHQILSHHITSHHITSHHITSHHITSHHITSHHITSHHITSHHITSHHITSNHITSHHITNFHYSKNAMSRSSRFSCIGPQQQPSVWRKRNQNWLPHPCLLGGPKEGGNATSPLHSWGSPTASAERRRKPELDTSPLPS